MTEDTTLNTDNPFAAQKPPATGFGKHMNGATPSHGTYAPLPPPPQPTHSTNPFRHPATEEAPMPQAPQESPMMDMGSELASEPTDAPNMFSNPPRQEPQFEAPTSFSDVPQPPETEPSVAVEALQEQAAPAMPAPVDDIPSFSNMFGQNGPAQTPPAAPQVAVETVPEPPEAAEPAPDVPMFSQVPAAPAFPDAVHARETAPVVEPTPEMETEPSAETTQSAEEEPALPDAFPAPPAAPTPPAQAEAEEAAVAPEAAAKTSEATPEEIWNELLSVEFKMSLGNTQEEAETLFNDLPEESQAIITENAAAFLQSFTDAENQEKAFVAIIDESLTILRSDAIMALDGGKRIQAVRLCHLLENAKDSPRYEAVLYNQGADMLQAFATGLDDSSLVDELVRLAGHLLEETIIFPADIHKNIIASSASKQASALEDLATLELGEAQKKSHAETLAGQRQQVAEEWVNNNPGNYL